MTAPQPRHGQSKLIGWHGFRMICYILLAIQLVCGVLAGFPQTLQISVVISRAAGVAFLILFIMYDESKP